jgi:ribonuclease HI
LGTYIDVYTDGGCHTPSGIGGWAAIIYDNPRSTEISGHESDTTSQRMELRAAIEGLTYLEQPSEVRLYSDSAYLVNGMNQRWYVKWQRNGWKNAKKKPVENPNLWKELVELSLFHNVPWMKVKGHAGIPANERCDALVRLEINRVLAYQRR